MSGDHSRFTHDPRRRYTAVLQQQGRVALDADWNEASAIGVARDRAIARDAFGAALVAPDTPDAFLIGLGTDGDLTIGPGRLWLNGLLAEVGANEGVSYLAQPFLRPAAFAGGDANVWLELWDREVGWIDDPALLDVALGGVDTTTRVQRVWQVRVEPAEGAGCGAPAPQPASAGRLTATALAPPAPDDPCLLPPVSGYRGLENRLYRVEVHDGGALGAARFKWSRDNGSIMAAVLANDGAAGGATLSLDRLGADAIQRLRIGDWVTVTDTPRLLDHQPGEMARIVAVREVDLSITLDRALPGLATDPAALTAACARVQRWDQGDGTAPLDGDGLIATAAGPIALEDGIELAFSVDPVDGPFATGDHWTFAARTANASIEPLAAAPPAGPRRRRLQLAAIVGGTVQDCRPKPAAPEACCCVAVAPGNSIQGAIDALPDEGGCVCLLAGVHLIAQTVVITRPNVTLKAESTGAVIQLRGDAPVLGIVGVHGMVAGTRVERIVLRRVGAPDATLALMLVLHAADTMIVDCRIGDGERLTGAALVAYQSGGLTVARCRLQGAIGGVVTFGTCPRLAVEDCSVALDGIGDEGVGVAGIAVLGPGNRVHVAGNHVAGALEGVLVAEIAGQLGFAAGEVTVVGNEVVMPGVVEGKLSASLSRVGIDVLAIGARVTDNRVTLEPMSTARATGIRLAGFELAAIGNIVTGQADRFDPAATVGIDLGITGVNPPVMAIGATVADNDITGCWSGVAAIGGGMLDLSANRVTAAVVANAAERKQAGHPPLANPLLAVTTGVALAGTVEAAVRGNVVAGAALGVLGMDDALLRVSGNTIMNGLGGIGLIAERWPAVSGNRLEELLGAGVVAGLVEGPLTIDRNVAWRCGLAGGVAIGIAVVLVRGETVLRDNEVRDLAPDLGGKPLDGIACALLGAGLESVTVDGNVVGYAARGARTADAEDRALLLAGVKQAAGSVPPYDPKQGGEVAVGPITLGGATIVGNRLAGAGRSALVELALTMNGKRQRSFGCVLFANNQVVHDPANPDKAVASVILYGEALSVTANHVRAPGKVASFLLSGPCPFIGNVMTGGAGQFAYPIPLSHLNQKVTP